jgi:hypothetical protein
MFEKKNSVLAVSRDAKTVKGEKLNVITGILYLAPAKISGYEVCPKATNGCREACLYTAGRGKMNMTQKARINKTKWFFEERKSFMEILVQDIAKVERKAKKIGFIPAIRLNGTSDIVWEKMKIVHNGKEYRNVMDAFPNVQFYDYTKILNRKLAISMDNYHLTYSLSENNDSDALEAIKQGYNVAVVVKCKRDAIKPISWGNYPAIDGDLTDVRFKDGKGNIVLLRAKGDANKDTSGFVRDINGGFNTAISLKIVA